MQERGAKLRDQSTAPITGYLSRGVVDLDLSVGKLVSRTLHLLDCVQLHKFSILVKYLSHRHTGCGASGGGEIYNRRQGRDGKEPG